MQTSSLSNSQNLPQLPPSRLAKVACYSSSSRLLEHETFVRFSLADLRAAGPIARRFFKRHMAQQYRFSSFGLIWALAPSVITAVVLIGGQRSRLIQPDQANVPTAFYGVFGLAMAQSFFESINSTRSIFTTHQNLLRRQNVPLEGLILANFVDVIFNTAVRLFVLAVVFFLFAIRPALATLPLGFSGLIGLIMVGGGLGLLIAPISSLKTDVNKFMAVFPWLLFAATPVFVPPSGANFMLVMVYAFNPLAWIFNSIRTAAYGAEGSLLPALIGTIVGMLLVVTGWLFCRLSRPYIVERLLV